MERMRRVVLCIVCLAASLCMLGCSSQVGLSGKLTQRSQIESLEDVPDAINESLSLLSNCELSVRQDGDSCYIYDGEEEIGFIEYYSEDNAFAVYSPEIDEENYDGLKATTDLMTAVVLACNASYSVDTAKEVILDVVTNDESTDNGVTYTVGELHGYSVLIVEL